MNIETRVRETFEDLAREVRPERHAWDSVKRTALRRQRQRVVIIPLASAVVLVAALVGITRLPLSSRTPAAGASPTGLSNVYRDKTSGFSLSYPEPWRAQAIEFQCRISEDGVLVTNLDHVFVHPVIENGCTSGWDFRGLPSSLVVVQLQHESGGPQAVSSPEPETEFPLSLDEAEGPYDSGEYGSPPVRILGITVHGDAAFSVWVWTGANATDQDREIARKIVASITFD